MHFTCFSILDAIRFVCATYCFHDMHISMFSGQVSALFHVSGGMTVSAIRSSSNLM